ncbi:neurexin [Echinococcus multilocularis]|uniref:Neurexin n=1 Tax=Echinococcus multilocularis TaxID=6211 RepID=A0A087W1M6_ECHMU|nr:neurexin [Echinococcus multilocularis]
MYIIALHYSLLCIVAGALKYGGPAVVLKDAKSTVEYASVPLFSETSLFIEFSGHSLQGRLLYAENATMGTFISLKINRPGTLRFEMKLTATNQSHQFIILSAPLDRTADQWHSADLRISLKEKVVILFVDGKSAYPIRIEDVAVNTARYSFGGYLHVGRLPPNLIADASKVVHFTAVMEFAFVGNIKSIIVNGRAPLPLKALNGAEIAPGLSHCHLLSREVARGGDSHWFCPQNLSCLDGLDGPKCGCNENSRKLGICRFQSDRPNLVFGEKTWLNFFPVIDTFNHGSRVLIHFKTRESNAVIVLAESSGAKNEAFIVLLLNGSIHFRLWSPRLQKNAIVQKRQDCDSPYSTCSDGTWHHLSFSYSPLQIQTEVDGDRQTIEIPKNQLRLQFKALYFGSLAPKVRERLQLQNIRNFIGCFKHIFYRSRKEFVDLIDLVKDNSTKQRRETEIGEIKCKAVAFQTCTVARKAKRDAVSHHSAITFVRPGGYLRSQQGWRTVSAGNITFKIRTLKTNCLLLFSSSGWPKSEKKHVFPRDKPFHPVNPIDRLTGTDIFSAELREGYLVFLLNTGSGINEFATENIWRGDQGRSSWFVADGNTHHVEIHLTNGSLSVTMDGHTLSMRPRTKPKYTILNLNGHLYIGGLPEELRDETPPQAWSARLREDFVGCLGALSIDGESLDLGLEVTARWAKGYVLLGESDLKGLSNMCTTQENPCGSGKCVQGSWSEPLCDCTQTNFVGNQCKEVARVLTFDGFQGIGVRLSRLPKQSEAESLVLRLQTFQKNALLFESNSVSSTAPDRFGIEIFDEQIVVFYNLGLETKRYVTTKIDSNGGWHTLQILRRSKRLDVSVDNFTMSYNIKDNATVLDSDYNCIGVLAEDVSVYNTELETDVFIGRLSQFKLNGLDIIKIISEVANYRLKESSYGSYDPGLLTLVDNWKDSIEITASTTKDERIRTFPLHFNGDEGLVEYTLRLEACLSIRLSLKTSTSNGIILAATNLKEDFMGLEIIDAHLHVRYRYNLIQGQFAFEKTAHLNDTQWHDIQVQVCTIGTFTLDIELDGEKLTPLSLPESQATASRHAFERLFLGGLPIEGAGKFRNRFRSTHEYNGCLADVEIVQKSVKSSLVIESNAFHPPKNPLLTAKYAKGVKLGCHLNEQSISEGAWKTGSSPGQCRPGVCGFGGRCVQQLDTYFCDCIMSGFRGQVCTDVATAIKYPSNRTGCAIFEFSPLRNTSRDTISFGIQTVQKSRATLLHITSHSKSLDFLRFELVPYRKMLVLRLTYNMGSGIQILQESNVNMVDGLFHVVRVIRNNVYLQLQVDSEDVLESTSEGSSGSHFNEVHQVYVGCDPTLISASVANYVGPTFVGHISGVNVNGVFLADLLMGEIISGIFYKDGKDILIDPTFTPKVRQIANLPANDMGAEQPYLTSSKPLTPLVVAKPNCFESDTGFKSKLANCKPVNPNGIVVPKWSLPLPNKPSSTSIQGNAWNLHQSMTQHHQAPAIADTSSADIGSKLYPSESEEIFPPWSHDRASQDDANRLNGVDNSASLEQLSEAEKNGQVGITSFLPSPNTWLLLAGCGTTLLLIALIIGYVIHKFRWRNEGSYNVEENRTFINRRLTSTLAPTLLLSPSLETATELAPLRRCTPLETEFPNKEWYV